MSAALDYWNLREGRRLAYRLIHAKSIGDARAVAGELATLFEISAVAAERNAPGAFARKSDEAMPPALPCRLRVEGASAPAGRGVGPISRAAGGDPDEAGNAAGQPLPPSAGGAEPPSRVASRLPSRAVEPSRPVVPPADTPKPKPVTGGGEPSPITELRELGAAVEPGDKSGVWVVDGKRMGIFSAEDYCDRLKRRKARDAA